MDLKQDALDFISDIQSIYLEERDMGALLKFMKEETSWIGTGSHEICRSLNDAWLALSLEKEEYSGSFEIINTNYEVQCLQGDICIVYGEIEARAKNGQMADIRQRLSAICQKKAEGMKLLHLHLSCPNEEQESGRYFVEKDSYDTKAKLRERIAKTDNELKKRNMELEALMENIPGGVHQCLYDETFTLLNMSNSFLSLLGYTRQEIKIKYHDNFMEMIFLADHTAVLQSVEQQLKYGNTVELEYRIRRKDGSFLWILDKGKLFKLADGTNKFYCVLLDITKQKEAREELRLSLERHKIIMNQTTDIIFEWDIIKDTLACSSNWIKKFGYEPLEKSISKEIPLSQNIHVDDMGAFLKIMKDSASGVPYSEAEFRIRDVTGDYRWCRIRSTVQYDASGVPVKATGVILNIDSEKQQHQSLLEEARIDALTGLLNKTASKNLMEEILCQMPQSYGIFFLIDLDDFKRVNDRYGHLCGDALLSDVGHVLQRIFHGQDVVGRIGGDEFLVYLPEIPTAQAQVKAQEIQAALNNITFQKGKEHVSCSIGAAIFPQDAQDFYNLYHCADQALYHMKMGGKGGCAVYNEDMKAEVFADGAARSAINVVIDSDIGSINEQLAKYSFKMLYRAVDTKTAVNQILEIVGRAYDVSRVYIFESSEDGLFCSNTFEWCGEGVTSEISRLQHLSYQEDLCCYLENFDENGVLYCKDIRDLKPSLYDRLARQGICSILQCAITEDEEFKGYVGFDECRENRYWTKEQVESLTLISNVLSTFLLKLRYKEQRTGSDRDRVK